MEEDAKATFTKNPISSIIYEITESSDNKKIGRHYPQVDYINLPKAHAIDYHNMPKKTIIFDEITLYKTAKCTDIISSGAINADGFLMSQKILAIFLKYDLGNYKTYKASVFHKGKKYDYAYLQVMNEMKSQLDYKKSTFYVADMLDLPVEDYEVNTAEAYEEMSKKIHAGDITPFEQYSYLNLKLGYFKENTKLPDFFTLAPCGVTRFISKRLHDDLVAANITGTEIEATRKIIF